MLNPLSSFPDPIDAYFELIRLRPELIVQDERIPIVTDKEQMRRFAAERNLPMGVVFNNFPYYYVLADLCEKYSVDEFGQPVVSRYRYARVVYTDPDSNGAVAVVKCGSRFGLLTVFRHAPRTKSIEFPRGFSDKSGLTPEQNIRKELCEELGISDEHCSVQLIGQVRADTGLSGGLAHVFLAHIDSPDAVRCTYEEGISRFTWVDEATLRKMIRCGHITDGFTLSAYAMYLSHI